MRRGTWGKGKTLAAVDPNRFVRLLWVSVFLLQLIRNGSGHSSQQSHYLSQHLQNGCCCRLNLKLWIRYMIASETRVQRHVPERRALHRSIKPATFPLSPFICQGKSHLCPPAALACPRSTLRTAQTHTFHAPHSSLLLCSPPSHSTLHSAALRSHGGARDSPAPLPAGGAPPVLHHVHAAHRGGGGGGGGRGDGL